MAANVIDRNQFVFDKEHDKVAVKEGENPWGDFKETINLNTTDKMVEERYKELQNMIMKRLKDKNMEKKARSESMTRNRSESGQEEEQAAKKAKEEEEEKKKEEKKKEEKKKEEGKKVEQTVKQIETKSQKKSPAGKNKKNNKNGF